MSATLQTKQEQDQQKLQASGFMFAIAGTMLFSLKSIFIKLAFMEDIDSTTLLFLRMSIAFPFYIAVLTYAIKTRPAKAAHLDRRKIGSAISLGFSGY